MFCQFCHERCGPGGFCGEACLDGYRNATEVRTSVMAPKAARRAIRKARVVYVRVNGMGLFRVTKKEFLGVITPKHFAALSVSSFRDSVCVATPEDYQQ